MTKQQEIKAAFCKGLEAFLLDYRDTEATVEVIKGYVDTLNDFIGEIPSKHTNDDDAVYIEYTYTDDNDTILITAHQGDESVKLAAIKRGNTGDFTEFNHIGSAESIAVNGAKDIEKALFRMLEAPTLIITLYRLIYQSRSWVFRDLDNDGKLEAMINGTCEPFVTSIPKAIKRLKSTEAKVADSKTTEELLNHFCGRFNCTFIPDGYQLSIEQNNEMPDELLLVIEYLNQNRRKEVLIKFKTQNGTYPVIVKCEGYSPRVAHNKDMLEIQFFYLVNAINIYSKGRNHENTNLQKHPTRI